MKKTFTLEFEYNPEKESITESFGTTVMALTEMSMKELELMRAEKGSTSQSDLVLKLVY